MAIETDTNVTVIATAGPAGLRGERGPIGFTNNPDNPTGGGFRVFPFSKNLGNLSAGQTIFSIDGGYNSGSVLVCVDGYQLEDGAGFIAADGTTIAIIQPGIEITDRVDIVVSGALFTSPGPVGDGSSLPNVGTAGTYGDATHIPRITLDAKGRTVNVELINVSGGGSSSGTLPAATSSTLGGIKTGAPGDGKFVSSFGLDGTAIYTTPVGTGGSNGSFTTITTTSNAGIGGTLTVSGTGATIAGTTSVTTLQASGNLSVSGTASLTGVTTTANAGIGGTLTVSGASTLTGNVTASNALSVGGTLNVTGTVTTTNGLTVGGGLNVTGGSLIAGFYIHDGTADFQSGANYAAGATKTASTNFVKVYAGGTSGWLRLWN